MNYFVELVKFGHNFIIKRDPTAFSYYKWIKDDGEQKRYEYVLNENSLVFDLGGYRGDWSDEIFKRYKSNIFIFEPVTSFYNILLQKFNSQKISLFNAGLSDKTIESEIFLDDDASSMFHEEKLKKQKIKLIDISDFILKNNIDVIDLIKINIEGGEYPVLLRLLESNLIEKCKNLQVQFHFTYPNAKSTRNTIREKLSKTHHLTYDYPWIWENWEINSINEK